MSEEDLQLIKNYLDRIEAAREHLIKQSRDIIGLYKRAIHVCVRGGDASKLVSDLKYRFTELYNSVKNIPELFYSNLLQSIAIEYVEALQFYNVVKESRFATLNELGVHPVAYILGLLDVIGELKRYSLELIKNNKIDDSFSILEKAESIYDLLSTLNYTDAIVPGFRRKLDIYRKVIDDWRELLIDLRSRKDLIDRIERIAI
uniref:Haloacid dehalogenase n=1 Tax=Ignisphaera aggregans TaxID=334771 RepID=A0A7J3I8C2_9CREN